METPWEGPHYALWLADIESEADAGLSRVEDTRHLVNGVRLLRIERDAVRERFDRVIGIVPILESFANNPREATMQALLLAISALRATGDVEPGAAPPDSMKI